MQKVRPYLDRSLAVQSWRLSTKILIAVAALLIVISVVNSLIVGARASSALEQQARGDVENSTNFLKFLLDAQGAISVATDPYGQTTLRFGNYSVRNDFTIVDALKRNTGSDATIFLRREDGEFERITTTLAKADAPLGRATGTVLEGPAATAAKRGENYTGRGPILGREYLSSYVLLRDENGAVIGMIFSGKPSSLIDQKVSQIQSPVIVATLLALTAGLGGLFLLISRVVSRPLRDLATAAERIGAGDYAARVPVRGDDEIGLVARTVNGMVDQITVNAQTQAAQNEDLQRQIVQLLDEVSSVAEGDLTTEAEVHEGALGAVADSFNYMIVELRGIIGRVNDATQQVSSSTDEILATTDILSRSAEQQAARIADTSTAVEEMAVSIQQVSENAAISAQVAREARATVEIGNRAVTATITGMERIREQVRETAGKIEQLGASSQEIGAIVSLIQEVADQTELLALNAAIEAAMAGEHGRGFAVVAEEVRRLAERTTAASQQIAVLVKGIQADTSEAIAAMALGTSEVNAGARLATEAGQSLDRIDSTAVQMAELIEAISLAAEQQARASAGIARAMGEISSVTTGTTNGAQQAATAVASLATLADDLHDSVSAFRLNSATGAPAMSGASSFAGVGQPGGGTGLPAASAYDSRGGYANAPHAARVRTAAAAEPSRDAVAVLERQSLYERLGGAANIDAVVEDFYQRVLRDASLKPIFEGVDMQHLKTHQKAFLSHALGGPQQYRGRQMAKAHTGLSITNDQFMAVAGHLATTLGAYQVPQPLIDEVIAHVATLQRDIVGK